MADDPWVVYKTAHPGWGILALPPEIAEMIGFPHPKDDKPTDGKPNLTRRTLAFLSRGPGRLRVVNMFRSSVLFGEEIGKGRLVAQSLISEKLYMNLPDSVEKHLGVKTEYVPARKASRTDDIVAWLVPADEYYHYRDATRDGGAYELPKEGPAHVYLVKSLFSNFMPSWQDLEAGVGSKTPVPMVQVRHGRKGAA